MKTMRFAPGEGRVREAGGWSDKHAAHGCMVGESRRSIVAGWDAARTTLPKPPTVERTAIGWRVTEHDGRTALYLRESEARDAAARR